MEAPRKSPNPELADAKSKKKSDLRVRLFLWWLLPDSNWGLAALQAAALPTELKSQISSIAPLIVQRYVLICKLLLRYTCDRITCAVRAVGAAKCVNKLNRKQEHCFLTRLGTDTLKRTQRTKI